MNWTVRVEEPIYGQHYLPRKFKTVVAVPPENDVDVFAQDLGFIAITDDAGAVIGSDDAGKYVCDTTYWSVLDFRKRRGFPEHAAFLHVPPVSEVWTVDAVARAIQRVLDASGLLP